MPDHNEKKEEKKPLTRTRNKPVKVRLIKQEKGRALIEWFDGVALQRGTIKAVEVVPGKKEFMIDKAILDDAAPYGDDLKKLIDLGALTAQAVEDALHARGIWELKDVQNNTLEARSALNEVVGQLYRQLMLNADRSKKS